MCALYNKPHQAPILVLVAPYDPEPAGNLHKDNTDAMALPNTVSLLVQVIGFKVQRVMQSPKLNPNPKP